MIKSHIVPNTKTHKNWYPLLTNQKETSSRMHKKCFFYWSIHAHSLTKFETSFYFILKSVHNDNSESNIHFENVFRCFMFLKWHTTFVVLETCWSYSLIDIQHTSWIRLAPESANGYEKIMAYRESLTRQ